MEFVYSKINILYVRVCVWAQSHENAYKLYAK